MSARLAKWIFASLLPQEAALQEAAISIDGASLLEGVPGRLPDGPCFLGPMPSTMP